MDDRCSHCNATRECDCAVLMTERDQMKAIMAFIAPMDESDASNEIYAKCETKWNELVARLKCRKGGMVST